MSCMFCFVMLFSKAFCCLMFVVLLLLFVVALYLWVFACISEQTLVKTKQQKRRSRKTTKTQIQLVQPEPERYLFAVE